MPTHDAVERILRAGVMAPSGDNTQPWSFKTDNDSVVVHSHAHLDHPILNVDARGTLLATGALLENISIAAAHEGFRAHTEILDPDVTQFRVTFQPLLERGHPLHEAISERHTHRGEYDSTLSASQRKALDVETGEYCRLRIIDDEVSIRRIARSAVLMEETALKSRKLHYHFFRSILWSAHENHSGKSGLFVKTTELPPPILALFRIIRYWPVMRIFQFLGLPKLAAKANAAVYARSGACVAILLDRVQKQDFIEAGRAMQRVWLTATKEGLAVQPLAGLIYLAEYVARTDDAEMSGALKERILEARKDMAEVCDAGTSTIAMMLRLGKPLKAASARTHRRKPALI